MGLGFRKVALFGPFLSSFLQMGLEMIHVQRVHFVPLQLFNNFAHSDKVCANVIISDILYPKISQAFQHSNPLNSP